MTIRASWPGRWRTPGAVRRTRSTLECAGRSILTVCAIAAVDAACGPPARAQQPIAPSAVASGIVYDSIARHPITGATVDFVSANDPSARPHTAVSDASGRYTLRDIPFGHYLAGFAHPALDSLGLASALRRVVIDGPTASIDLATPSVRTVMAALCPTEAQTDSTGLLLGHVRTTDEQTPVGGASAVVEWTETVVTADGIADRTRRVTARSAEPGWFAICGLPTDVVVQARAFAAVDSTGIVEIEIEPNALRHVTFFLGGASPRVLSRSQTGRGSGAAPDTAWRGRARLRGTVTDSSGKPVADAHAVVWGTKLDAVTDQKGGFALAALPGGTQTLEIRAVGFVPVTTVVHLAESAPATVNVVLAKRAAVLSTVDVRAERESASDLAGFNRRHRVGFGQFRTPDEIARRGRNTKLGQLLQDVQNLTVDSRSGRTLVTMQRNATTAADLRSLRASCVPTLYVDGHIDRTADFDAWVAGEIAAIEIYREHSRPPEFVDPANACGVIAITTRPAPATKRKPPGGGQ